MTRKEKKALLKQGVKLLEPVLREEAALVPSVGRRLRKPQNVEIQLSAEPSAKLKKLGLLAGGAALALALANNAARAASIRHAMARELKRQLKPVNEKLDKLEKENAALRSELEKERKGR